MTTLTISEAIFRQVSPNPASKPQTSFLLKLAGSRVAPRFGETAEERVQRLGDLLAEDRIGKRLASELIDWFKEQPFDIPEEDVSTPHVVVGPGVYELPSGAIYVVKMNRGKTRSYAKRLVEIHTDRLNENDEHVQIEFEYAPGAIYEIRPEHRMDVDRAKALTLRYGRCIACGRHLKAAQSVERGIGPVCIKSFDPVR